MSSCLSCSQAQQILPVTLWWTQAGCFEGWSRRPPQGFETWVYSWNRRIGHAWSVFLNSNKERLWKTARHSFRIDKSQYKSVHARQNLDTIIITHHLTACHWLCGAALSIGSPSPKHDRLIFFPETGVADRICSIPSREDDRLIWQWITIVPSI